MTLATERPQAAEAPPAVKPHADALARVLPALDAEGEELAAERRALFDARGPVNRPDVHAARLAELDQKAAAHAEKVRGAVGAVVERAEADRARFVAEADHVEALAGADPLLALDPGQLARVRTLEPLISADVGKMSPAQLAARLAQAQVRADRVELVLLARAAGPRLEELAATGYAASAPHELARARAALGEIAATLSPGQAEAAEKARTLRKLAGDLARFQAQTRSAAIAREGARAPLIAF